MIAADSVNLDALLTDHRALLRAELFTPRLHDSDGEFGTGMPFAPAFERFIDWDRRQQRQGVRPSRPGPSKPWFSAYWAQWVECLRSHPEHRERREWRGSLCRQLVTFTVRREMSVADASLVLGVSPDRAGRTLRNALMWIESHVDRQRERSEQRAKAAEPYLPWSPPEPSGERHDQPGLHRSECPRCRGEAA